MREANASLGKTELEVLRYVADHHPISVGQLAEHMAATNGQARTTILTTMERLRRKGYLARSKSRGVYHYRPKIAKEKLFRQLVGSFVETALGGSIAPFIAFLAESGPLSDSEMATLRQLVIELETQRKEERR
jgi:predicted transcriptional regulator